MPPIAPDAPRVHDVLIVGNRATCLVLHRPEANRRRIDEDQDVTIGLDLDCRRATLCLHGYVHGLQTNWLLAPGSDSLAEQANSVGVKPFSDEFDEAAALAGMPYSRAWDAYLDRATWAEAERRPLAHMP